jgi:two-component system response regulator NreC
MKIRVFVADDHGVLRGGLRALINGQADMEVVGEAADGFAAGAGISQAKPDVALMDISMPACGGLDAIANIKRKRLATRMLVLTVHDEPGYMRAAVAAGAVGYVVKKAVDTELLAAIRAVAQGRTFLYVSADPPRRPMRASQPGEDGMASVLSGREREVLCLVAEGHTNREIADQLGLSVKSVETYRGRLMEKLGLNSRAELVRYALECGFLRPGKSG